MLTPLCARAQAADPAVAMQAHFDRGLRYYEDKQFVLAASEFRAAYEAKASASLLYNEAVCHEKLKDYARAATLFREYLRTAPQARDRREIEDRIEDLEKALGNREAVREDKGRAEVRGFVGIESDPPGATIYLDTKEAPPLGQAPWNGPLEGRHKLILVAKGYREAAKDIEGDPRRVTDIVIALRQDYMLAWLEVRADVAGADVYLDGTEAGPVGKTPYLNNVAPGPHTILVAKEGFTEERRRLTAVAGEIYRVDVALHKAPIGFIRVSGPSIEGALVKLDGHVVCTEAPCRFQAPDGEHNISVEKAGQKSYTRKMEVVPATETELSVKLMPEESKTDVIWKMAFAGAFIGGGVVLGLQAKSVYGEIQSDIAKGMPPVAGDDSRYLKGKIFAYAADTCFLLGAITAVVGTVSLLSEHGPPSVGSAASRELGGLSPSVTPEVAPGYVGVSADIRW
jgi:hypothetical protein